MPTGARRYFRLLAREARKTTTAVMITITRTSLGLNNRPNTSLLHRAPLSWIADARTASAPGPIQTQTPPDIQSISVAIGVPAKNLSGAKMLPY